MLQNAQGTDIKKYTRIGMMCAVAVVLSYFPEIPMAFFAPWLKLDFSYVPILLTGFSLGPIAGFVILVIKNIFKLLTTSSVGVGEIADMLMGSSMLFSATLIYRRNRTIKGALTGMVVGICMMIVVGVLSNRFILLPFFLGDGFNGYMESNPYVLWIAVAPFNLLKGSVVCAITFALYKRLSPFLQQGFQK